MNQSEFLERVKKKRRETFPSAFDLAYSSFCTLGFDRESPAFFLSSASQCVERLREECWVEFLKAEDIFTKRILREESEKASYAGLTQHEAVSAFIDKHMPDIYDLCLSNTQSRRSRAGKEFEAIIEMLLIGCDIPYTSQGNIGKNFFTEKGLGKMVDEVIPGTTHYIVNKRKCILISAKTTLRERWQEVAEEMTRTGAKEMYLATLDEKITPPVLKTLSEENIVITTTRNIKEKNYASNVEVIAFEDLLSVCLGLGKYWNTYQFSAEEKEEIISGYKKQYQDSKDKKPYVANYAQEMIRMFSK